ncbi:MAG: hypothetical protein ACQER9_00875 [Nanobdellota archaeon]
MFTSHYFGVVTMLSEMKIRKAFIKVKKELESVRDELNNIKKEHEELKKSLSGKKTTAKKTASKKAPSKKDYFVSSKNGTKFHKTSCALAQNIKKDSQVVFKSRNDALTKGYKPCKTCQS